MNKIIDINGFKAVVGRINISIQDVRDMVINKADKDHTHNNLAAISYVDEAIANISIDLNKKVDKVEGKSLMLDTEIERLANVSNYDDTALKQRVGNLEAIDHSQFLTEHQDLSEYAKKTEVPAQPNFTYQINMVASDQQPSVTTTGTYPNLVITFNIPQGAGGGTGGNDGPVDTGTPRMWYGWIPYDETGAAGFSTPEEIGTGMTKTVIQFGLDNRSLTEENPHGFDSKLELGSVPENAFICCIVPIASNVVSYYDNAGAKVKFSTLDPGVYVCPAEGLEITNPIDGVYYKIYGFMSTAGMLQDLWICEE